MPRFVFKLEAVLTQRRWEEEACQTEVARLMQQKATSDETLRQFKKQIDMERREQRSALEGGGAWSGAITSQSLAIARIEALARQEAIRLAGVMHRLDGARARLTEAMTNRKAVEQLRDRRYEAWLREERVREEAQLDELAVMRARRREAA